LAEQNDSKALNEGSSLPKELVQDCLFLAFIILLSAILHVQGLGIYSDDWMNMYMSSLSSDQSLPGIIRFIFFARHDALIRPVQPVYYAMLYWQFGLYPLGYHITNSVVLTTGIILFYLTLRELRLNRLLALAIPTVFGLLPHYSTDRFWFAAFVGNLSMALYFLSLYADLRMLRLQRLPLWFWKLLALVSLLGSTLAYEVFLPLFFFNVLVVLYHKRRIDRAAPISLLSTKGLTALLGSNLLLLMLVIGFKASVSSRRPWGDYPHLIDQIKYIVEGSIFVNYRRYGSGLPRLVWKIAHDYPDALAFAVGGILGLTALVYLFCVARQSKLGLPGLTTLIKLTGLGFLIFGMGYAVFFGPSCGFSPTGMENRVAIAAAVGVAFSFVGGLGLVASVVRPQKLRRLLFCVLIALLSTSGFVITNTIASFWKAAYSRQQEILADIREHVPTLPAGSTLLVDGTCRYHGPGVIFECFWGLTGALNLVNGVQVRRADIVTPSLKITKTEISNSMGGREYPDTYSQLYLYQLRQKVIHKLTNVDSTVAYLAELNQDRDKACPQGQEGQGVAIF
jgi:hypothetical protein